MLISWGETVKIRALTKISRLTENLLFGMMENVKTYVDYLSQKNKKKEQDARFPEKDEKQGRQRGSEEKNAQRKVEIDRLKKNASPKQQASKEKRHRSCF